MNWVGRHIRTLISAACLAAGSAASIACGFEDPNSASMARGALNLAYPHALYVTSAVWRAQMEGVIDRNELSAPAKALGGYQKVARLLGTIRDLLAAPLDGRGAPAFSMVLIGPMLWTHYEPADDGLKMTVHTDAPSNGDVIIVTDEPVIAALIEGRITPRSAEDLGLIRFYGAPDRVQQVTSWFGRLSAPENNATLDTAQQTSH